MKLKEAQLLGILTLMAVCILLLCMWGSDEDADQAGAEGDLAALLDEPASGSGKTESILQDLISDGTPAANRRPGPPVSVFQVGGPRQRPSVASEESRISDIVEDSRPDEIGIVEIQPEPEPEAEAPPRIAVAPRPARPRFHVVQRGETLGEISQKYYGTSTKWRDIAKANDNLDPRRMSVGMRLRIPALSAVTTAAAPAERRTLTTADTADSAPATTYTVKQGDTLYDVARKIYNDGSRWKAIYNANRARISDSRRIRPGMELVIP